MLERLGDAGEQVLPCRGTGQTQGPPVAERLTAQGAERDPAAHDPTLALRVADGRGPPAERRARTALAERLPGGVELSGEAAHPRRAVGRAGRVVRSAAHEQAALPRVVAGHAAAPARGARAGDPDLRPRGIAREVERPEPRRAAAQEQHAVELGVVAEHRLSGRRRRTAGRLEGLPRRRGIDRENPHVVERMIVAGSGAAHHDEAMVCRVERDRRIDAWRRPRAPGRERRPRWRRPGRRPERELPRLVATLARDHQQPIRGGIVRCGRRRGQERLEPARGETRHRPQRVERHLPDLGSARSGAVLPSEEDHVAPTRIDRQRRLGSGGRRHDLPHGVIPAGARHRRLCERGEQREATGHETRAAKPRSRHGGSKSLGPRAARALDHARPGGSIRVPTTLVSALYLTRSARRGALPWSLTGYLAPERSNQRLAPARIIASSVVS